MEIRKTLHEKWEKIKSTVHSTGSDKKLKGPTYAFVIYLDLIETFPDKFITGTDFVASMADPEHYPGKVIIHRSRGISSFRKTQCVSFKIHN